jgi:hypothetical protein
MTAPTLAAARARPWSRATPASALDGDSMPSHNAIAARESPRATAGIANTVIRAAALSTILISTPGVIQ